MPERSPCFPGGNEILDDVLCFAQHLEVRRLIEMRARGDVGPTDDDRLAVGMAEFDDALAIGLLVQHATGHDHVGPSDVVRAQILGVAIDELELPMLGQQRGNGDQTERSGRITRIEELAGVRIVPERVRNEFRINQQHPARAVGHSWYPPNRRYRTNGQERNRLTT